MSLDQLFSEVHTLPDDYLQQELNQPSGRLPGWMVLGEIQTREQQRQTGGQNVHGKPTIADKYRQQAAGPSNPYHEYMRQRGMV